MAERGAPPKISAWRRTALRAISAWTSPLLPDDYLELINPLWSTRELRGRVEQIRPEGPDAATVVIRPGYEWVGHRPGQYLRIGVDIDGKRHWRAYSLTSEPERPDGWISVTVKHVDEGVVSPHLVRRLRPGAIVTLGGVEGTFTLPDPLPEKLLFVSAGSGVTPVRAMLRSLECRDALRDVVHLHSAPTHEQVIFGDELRRMAERHPGFTLHERHTRKDGRIAPQDVERLCPDWRERETMLCGPPEMLESWTARWEEEELCDRLHKEQFQPVIGTGDGEQGEGGTIRLRRSDVEATSDGSTPILVAGEEAGAQMPYGCRIGVCHTCIGILCSGQVRDLRTGEVHGEEGEWVRTCVNAPEGPVELDL